MKASKENNGDHADSDVAETVVDVDKTIDLTAPLRHFHRAVKSRDLSSGPLANPRRTRLV